MTSWIEQPLFVEEFQVVHLLLWNERSDGWTVTSQGRRFFTTWAQGEASAYSALGRAEALDVAAAELVRFLEL